MKAMLAKKTPDLAELLNNDNWVAEQKYDGQRFMVQIKDREARAYNRKGDELNMPLHIAAAFDHKGFAGEWIFDGEFVDDCYYIFDILMVNDQDLTKSTWELRHGALDAMSGTWDYPEFIKCVTAAETTAKKEALFKTVTTQDFEGIVFKSKRSKYQPGKSNMWLKYKITDTCDAIVTEVNRKNKEQAVTLSLYEDGELIEVGGLKIPASMVGEIGLDTVVEVRYLYSTADRKLYQPVFLGIRTDKAAAECSTSQLER